MAKNNRRRGGYGFGFNLTGPGTIFTLAFIGLAVGMGILLSRGVTPSSTLSDPGQTGDLELITEAPGKYENKLQLKTLKFRECASTVTIDLLLDRSGSMGDPTPSGVAKIVRLREAVNSMLDGAKDSSIIGIQSFNGFSITNDVPVSYYKDIRSIIPQKLDALQPGSSTPTYHALAYSRDILKTALPVYKERKFNFIFISDGAPCPGIGCPGNEGDNQDPRLYSPNPADEIKDLGVNVFTVGVFGYNQPDRAPLEDLLKSIASKPENYYAANTGDQLKDLLKQISNRICAQEATPTP